MAKTMKTIGSPRNHIYSLAGLAAFMTLLLYLPALRNEFVWDDMRYIVNNAHIRSLDVPMLKWAFFDFYAANWHPLTWISLAIDYAAWGLDPFGYHLENILLHGVNVFLVVVLTFSILKTHAKQGAERTAALFSDDRTAATAAGVTGLLFGIHPLHVESVAWIAERKDLLCALFFLTSIIWYTDYRRGEEDHGNHSSGRSGRRYLLAVGFFALALLSKPMAVSLPAVLLIMDWYLFKKITSTRTFATAVLDKAPFIALSLASSTITMMAQKGAMQLMDIPFTARLLVAAQSLLRYLGNTVAPFDLVPFYPYPGLQDIYSAAGYFPAALIIGLTAIVILTAKKQGMWLAVWGYYVITLLPVLGIVQVGRQSMADRYMYLPSLGPLLLAGVLVALGLSGRNAAGQNRRKQRAVAAVTAIAAVGLAYATVVQIGLWREGITLWSYVIEHGGAESALPYINRGMHLHQKGLVEEAIRDYDRAILLDPLMVEPYHDRATAFEQTGRTGKAIEDLKKVIALSPRLLPAYSRLGILYGKSGSLTEAIETFSRAIAFDPNNDTLYANRGYAYALAGESDRALQDYNQSLALNPADDTTYVNRANLYLKKGDKTLALSDFQEACRYNNKSACASATTLSKTAHKKATGK
jgi:protein O-mannosyl-transferase